MAVFSDLYVRVLADLAAHPDGATANTIGDRLDANGRMVFQVLESLERRGQAQRTREGTKAWEWTPVPAAPDPPSPTGCPACGSDDYEVLETGPDGPDYGGPKRCESCGEEWT